MEHYFTSDWHFFHRNVIRYCNRPFKTIDEMQYKILEMYAETVQPKDVVYYLGDFAFGRNIDLKRIERIIRQMCQDNKVHFILGNHDRQTSHLMKRYGQSVSRLKRIQIEENTITLCHFPMTSFHKSHHNAWQLYGHHHSNTNDLIKGKRWNVCLEANNYQMVSYSQLKKIMPDREDNWDLDSKSYGK